MSKDGRARVLGKGESLHPRGCLSKHGAIHSNCCNSLENTMIQLALSQKHVDHSVELIISFGC